MMRIIDHSADDAAVLSFNHRDYSLGKYLKVQSFSGGGLSQHRVKVQKFFG